jgi:CO dehydrogenase maturation factor
LTKTIAVAGKGGTGKTTVSALLIHFLSEKGTVLAIDGDPSENLNMALGVPLVKTVGGVRERMTEKITDGTYDQTIAKQQYLEGKIMESLVEADKFDILAMGRPEGPGCYCGANHILRASIDHLADNYDYVVADCEAGMEHISRQTTRDVDFLLLMTDPTIRGIATAERMRTLMTDLRTSVGEVWLIINRVSGKVPEKIEQALEESGLKTIAIVSDDPYLAAVEAEGKPAVELPPKSPLWKATKKIADRIALNVVDEP